MKYICVAGVLLTLNWDSDTSGCVKTPRWLFAGDDLQKGKDALRRTMSEPLRWGLEEQSGGTWRWWLSRHRNQDGLSEPGWWGLWVGCVATGRCQSLSSHMGHRVEAVLFQCPGDRVWHRTEREHFHPFWVDPSVVSVKASWRGWGKAPFRCLVDLQLWAPQNLHHSPAGPLCFHSQGQLGQGRGSATNCLLLEM